MKWIATVSFLNLGMVFICFALMARENRFDRALVDTIFGGGQFMLLIAAILFMASLDACATGPRGGFALREAWERATGNEPRNKTTPRRCRISSRQVEQIAVEYNTVLADVRAARSARRRTISSGNSSISGRSYPAS